MKHLSTFIEEVAIHGLLQDLLRQSVVARGYSIILCPTARPFLYGFGSQSMSTYPITSPRRPLIHRFSQQTQPPQPLPSPQQSNHKMDDRSLPAFINIHALLYLFTKTNIPKSMS